MAASMQKLTIFQKLNLSSYANMMRKFSHMVQINQQCVLRKMLPRVCCNSFLHSNRIPLMSTEQKSTNTSTLNYSKRKYSQTVKVEDTEEDDVLYKTIELEVKAHDTALLNSYEKFVTMAAGELEIIVSKIWTPPKVIDKISQLKSVHVYKKHWVQYEMRTHFRIIQLKHLTGSTADTLLEYIERNLPEGIAMKVTRHKVEVLPEHIKPPT